MLTKFIEAVNVDEKGQPFNWGKFMLARFTAEEWARRSAVTDEDPESLDSRPLLRQRGWGMEHLLILDLETGEGAIFKPGGLAAADLRKHRVWVCPLFEPFLTWLYKQDLRDFSALPSVVKLSWEEAPPAMAGYRRTGGNER